MNAFSYDCDVGTYPAENALFHHPLSCRNPELGIVLAAVIEVWMHEHVDIAKLHYPVHSIRVHIHVELKSQVMLHRNNAWICLQGRRRSMWVFF